jgi:recombinational DNA repair protein RecR
MLGGSEMKNLTIKQNKLNQKEKEILLLMNKISSLPSELRYCRRCGSCGSCRSCGSY